jgi:hypothetical protein
VQIFEPPPVVAPPAPKPRRGSHRVALRSVRLGVPDVFRRPLAWVIAAETAVTAAFVLAAAHLLAASLPAAPAAVPLAAPSLPPTLAATPADVAPDVTGLVPASGTGSPAPQPALGQSAGFLGGLLSGLNRDQASFERAQWSALQALAGAIRSYIEDVVVPAVEKAERGAASSRSP